MARTAVVAGTASATVNAVNRRSQSRAVEQQEAAAYREQQATASEAAPQPAPPAPAAAGGGDDLVIRLAELGRLRDSSVLTPGEFGAAKAKLLG